MSLQRLAPACLALCTLVVSAEAHASFSLQQRQIFPRTHFESGQPVSQKEPLLMEADEVHYDQENAIVTATGKVTITQNNTILIADTVRYDENNDIVNAAGNISVLEPSGNVYFADSLMLKDDMKEGIVRAFRARLADNSLFAAAHAHKKDENITELYNASYSPCKVCSEKEGGGDPLWQIRADKITVNEAEQTVSYDNADMELYGVPVLYTPYLAHATPGADNQSGLLIPDYRHSSNLGSVVQVPVYYSIAPDRDITLEPIYTTKNGAVMAGDYREMFNEGPLSVNGSLTEAPRLNSLGQTISGNEVRGHIFADGTFKINDDADWGVDLQRSTDKTYLRLYDFSQQTLLTSRAFVEGFRFGGTDRSYASLQALSFQGLQATDNSHTMPQVLPLGDVNYESTPGVWNSRFTFDANAMSLYRQLGDDSRRLSGTGGFKIPYMTDDGQLIEIDTTLRSDVYSVNNVPQGTGPSFNGVTGRVIPQISATWRYPFINRWDSLAAVSSVMIEPIVQFTASPNGGNSIKIPNEDSLVPEFTDSNLFADNRYAGLDRVETGPRMSYGLRGQAQLQDTHSIDWLFGQHYQINTDGFPYSNDPNSHLSDYVGKVGLNYDPVTLAYRFRLDRDNFAPKRSEVDGSYSLYPFVTTLSYLSLKDDPILGTRQEIVGTETLSLTREWSWSASARHDLLLNKFTSAVTGLTYKNECIAWSAVIDRENTRILDIVPSTEYLLRISLKNLE